MKKETQNTLVYDFIGTAFCLVMAFVLILMFSGCSNDESDPSAISLGGSTEETRIYALAGRAGDVLPRLRKPEGSENPAGFILAAKGTIVTVHELDSVTFDTTGITFVDTIDNDEGRFEFKDLSLSSPYVLIETRELYDSIYVLVEGSLSEDSAVTAYRDWFKAVVDLREKSKISLNRLTNAKAPYLLNYLAEGNSFDEANQLAERAVLESLGIYEDLGSFENLSDSITELSFVAQLLFNLAVIDTVPFDQTPNFDLDLFLVYSNPEITSKFDDAAQVFLSNSRKANAYQVGYYASQNNLGECTESREDEVHTFKNNRGFFDVVCRSKKWVPGFKKMDYTKGTMQDPRDGKTYKTVTYNWDSGAQTWMAENLDLVDTTSSTIDSALKVNLTGSIFNRERLSNAEMSEVYGHVYPWTVAMNIGDSDIGRIEFDTCVVLAKKKDTTITECGAATRDALPELTQKNYQGICPDGWRIPTWNDWKTLLQNMGAVYGIEYSKVATVLYDETATGFGLYTIIEPSNYMMNEIHEQFGDDITSFYYNMTFYNIAFNLGIYNDIFIVADTSMYSLGIKHNWFSLNNVEDNLTFGKENERYEGTNFYITGSVRCIRN